jgi:hypothetical protein
MAKPSFLKLRDNYPYPSKLNHDQLFETLGWDDLKGNSAYNNTCAIRMSYCLIQSGVDISGRLKILKGDHKGKMIDPGQKSLTSQMKNLFDQPQVFKNSQENSFIINKKKGIVSFMDIDGYRDASGNSSGHIDLIWTEKNSTTIFGWELWSSIRNECGSHCYWTDSKEILFWEFK